MKPRLGIVILPQSNPIGSLLCLRRSYSAGAFLSGLMQGEITNIYCFVLEEHGLKMLNRTAAALEPLKSLEGYFY